MHATAAITERYRLSRWALPAPAFSISARRSNGTIIRYAP